MKTKLLKKMRKRFDWYINQEGWPIILDSHNEDAIVLSPHKQNDIKDQVEKHAQDADLYLEPKAYAWLLAKKYMIDKSGVQYQKIISRYKFRQGRNRAKLGKNFSLIKP